MKLTALGLKDDHYLTLKRSRTAQDRWRSLREHVERGTYRTFLTESTTAVLKNGRRQKLVLSGDYLLEDDDSAGDRFTKIIAQQIFKLREAQVKKLNSVVPPEIQKQITEEDQLKRQKEQEAYIEALKCVAFPLQDHAFLLEEEIENPFSPNKDKTSVKQYAKAIANHFGQYVGLSGKPCLNGVKKVFAVSAPVLKQLKHIIKPILADPPSDVQNDTMYHHALIHFYEEVVKKRAAQFVAAGTSYEDLLQLFASYLLQQLRNALGVKANEPIPLDKVQNLIHPSSEIEEAILDRVQRLATLMKEAAETACTEEAAEHVQRRMSRVAMQRVVAAGMDVAVDQVVPEKPRHRKTISQTRSGDNEDKIEGVALEAVPEVTIDRMMAEWLKDTFAVARETHESTWKKIVMTKMPESLELEFKERLKVLENEAKEIEDSTLVKTKYYGLGPDNFSKPEAYYYWRKQEKHALLAHVNTLHQRYIDPKIALTSLDTLNTNDSVPSDKDKHSKEKKEKKHGKVRLCVHIIEAKNLAIKDDTGTSDPYCVVEYGEKQRFETHVIYRSLYPRWNQEVTLEVKTGSSKQIHINVWDKDEIEENPSVFSSKYWKDEADDFLGQISFDVSDLLDDLRQSAGQRADRWYVLQKRSSRSHVSGEIRISFEIYEDCDQNSSSKKVTASAKSIACVNEKKMEDPISLPSRLQLFPNGQHLYRLVLEKLLVQDVRTLTGRLGEFSLSAISLAILEELGERWRIPKLSRELMYFELLTEKYKNPTLPDSYGISAVAAPTAPTVHTLMALYQQVDKLILQSISDLKQIKLISSAKTETNADGTAHTIPPLVSGVGEVVLSLDEVDNYAAILRTLVEFQELHIQRYRDCFPCDKPVGALVTTLSMLSAIWENEVYQGQLKTTLSNDSGINVSSTESSPSGETFHDHLMALIHEGVTARYARIYELATSDSQDPTRMLVLLADRLMEELDTDLDYFRQPFAADADIVSIVANVYLKNFFLEMENASQQVKAQVSSSKEQPLTDGPALFDLFHRVQELQETYLAHCDSTCATAREMKSEFSLHRWFTPYLQLWLSQNEKKLLEWIDSAITMDPFESMHPEGGTLHSTSVIDMFFCMHQMTECLKKLDWVEAGGYLSEWSHDEREAERIRRQLQWTTIMTRFGKIMMKGVAKYCSVLSIQIVESYVKRQKSKLSESTSSLISLGDKTSSRSDLSSQLELIRHVCVKLNNFEAARLQLNELYDTLHVRELTELVEQHRHQIQPSEPTTGETLLSTLSGSLTIKVVLAENLMACDSNGLSDPYAVIKAHQLSPTGLTGSQKSIVPPSTVSPTAEDGMPPLIPLPGATSSSTTVRDVAKTRVLSGKLNPRWDETFSCFLRQATHFHIQVFDHDLLSADDLCGYCRLDFSPALCALLQDQQTHDIWLDLRPQGKILLRLQWEGAQQMDDKQQLATLDFYFRKAFRELKRTMSDTQELLSETLGERMVSELVRAVKTVEKRGFQGRGLSNSLKQFFSFKAVARTSEPAEDVVVSPEELDAAMTPMIEHLNQVIGVWSQHAYPRIHKDFLRKIWKAFLGSVESLLIPALYGDPSLAPLQRTKPLTERQVLFLDHCVELMKAFLHADGFEGGVPIALLENRKYLELKETTEWYWRDMDPLCQRYLLGVESLPQGTQSTVPLDAMRDPMDWADHALMKMTRQEKAAGITPDHVLRILKIRSLTDPDKKKWQEFIEVQMKLRSERLRWNQ